MKRLPWRVSGARLHLPRDLDVSHAVGRMGVVTPYDLWPLFWGSINTARVGFGRLLKLGLLRTFERDDLSHPAWYSLTEEGAAWVVEEIDCEAEELRVVGGIRRANLAAIRTRNRSWVSIVLACRKAPAVRLALFRPEWELRRLKTAAVGVVPDAMVVLSDETDGGGSGWAWMVEFDAGTERLAVWEAKARSYAEQRNRGALYGAARWNVLALVPSARRARSVASAVARVGAGGFVFVGVDTTLEEGRALDPLLWRASALASDATAPAGDSLTSGEKTPISDPARPGPSPADRGSSSKSEVVS